MTTANVGSPTNHRTPVDASKQAVCSYNEWDPLEEVIVGVLDHATIPEFHLTLAATMPEDHMELFKQRAGQRFDPERVAAGQRELDELARLLEAEGVIVRRPEPLDHGKAFTTPDWSQPCGVYAAMPRDVALVIGDEIIEAPMAWRSRYFEIHAYRQLFRSYFQAGARWTAAPRPMLRDDAYDPDYEQRSDGELRLAVSEVEPTFDAADFIRCGRDVFGQRSHVTNALGIAWLKRHLEGRFRVHELRFDDPHPMHIDATLMPLAPGKVLINPERVPEVPSAFRSWEVLVAPPPCIPLEHPMYMSSRWVNMNILMLDERRVVVEQGEVTLQNEFKRWGFEPIPCPFRNFNSFGGSFHCATLDVRRRGELVSLF